MARDRSYLILPEEDLEHLDSTLTIPTLAVTVDLSTSSFLAVAEEDIRAEKGVAKLGKVLSATATTDHAR
jgi:hypothetical protein